MRIREILTEFYKKIGKNGGIQCFSLFYDDIHSFFLKNIAFCISIIYNNPRNEKNVRNMRNYTTDSAVFYLSAKGTPRLRCFCVMDKLIELKNIIKEFDGERILDDISMVIHDKEFVTLLGPSGCGKTTTLRIIGGFVEADRGDLYFSGKRVNDMPAYKRPVNTVFQRYALFPHLNVYENIAFALRLKKLPEAEIKERVGEMLHMVHLDGFQKRKVTLLSGGQQQ